MTGRGHHLQNFVDGIYGFYHSEDGDQPKGYAQFFKGYLEKLDFLFKIKAYEEFYHRHIVDISESRISLTGGEKSSHNEEVGQNINYSR
ncbi:MAG: hypothetical protein GY702_08570 [Desulfobulbaceae bacterium]|nr:hypothetical protein [Desulfobulbaceae bacterium]